MGKPRHHCDPRDSTYLKFDDSKLSSIDGKKPSASGFIRIPSVVPCPDLSASPFVLERLTT